MLRSIRRMRSERPARTRKTGELLLLVPVAVLLTLGFPAPAAAHMQGAAVAFCLLAGGGSLTALLLAPFVLDKALFPASRRGATVALLLAAVYAVGSVLERFTRTPGEEMTGLVLLVVAPLVVFLIGVAALSLRALRDRRLPLETADRSVLREWLDSRGTSTSPRGLVRRVEVRRRAALTLFALGWMAPATWGGVQGVVLSTLLLLAFAASALISASRRDAYSDGLLRLDSFFRGETRIPLESVVAWIRRSSFDTLIVVDGVRLRSHDLDPSLESDQASSPRMLRLGP